MTTVGEQLARNRCPVSGGFYGPGALVSLGRRRRATGRPEKCIFHAHVKKTIWAKIGPLSPFSSCPRISQSGIAAFVSCNQSNCGVRKLRLQPTFGPLSRGTESFGLIGSVAVHTMPERTATRPPLNHMRIKRRTRPPLTSSRRPSPSFASSPRAPSRRSRAAPSSSRRAHRRRRHRARAP